MKGVNRFDAAFEMDGWHYIVECRWRDSLADIQQLDGLAGQVRPPRLKARPRSVGAMRQKRQAAASDRGFLASLVAE